MSELETPTEEASPSAAYRAQRAIRHRAEVLVDLAKTDAFQLMQRELKLKSERMHKDFAAGLLIGEALDQRQIDYDRGFIEGLAYIDQMIRGAEQVLARLDREQEKDQPEDEIEGSNW